MSEDVYSAQEQAEIMKTVLRRHLGDVPIVDSVDDLIDYLLGWTDCMNYAWTIICNVSEGDWTKQSTEWHQAAARCREQYHALLDGPDS